VSITTWTRLEPIPRTGDPQTTIEARIADPLWFLARQWQTGEFRGEDAGSPIVADLRAVTGRIDRYRLGPPAADNAAATASAVDLPDGRVPLETLVERERVRAPGRQQQLSVEAGLHFFRLLDAAFLTATFLGTGAAAALNAARASYLRRYTMPKAEAAATAAVSLRTLAGGRALDGARLYADLVAHRGAAPTLTTLPADPVIPTVQIPLVLQVANAWLAWYDALLSEPVGDTSAWADSRLEYAFAVAAPVPGGRVHLVADEYADGHLDWHAFRIDNTLSIGPPTTPAPLEPVRRLTIPAPVKYPGMPADRFWEFEDGRVNFGAVDAGATDLTRLLLVEFALVYANDWFVIPIDLAVGSVCSIQALIVTDTFGIPTSIGPTVSPPNARWAMFQLSGASTGAAQNLFFLPPTLPRVLQGEPVEEVALFRDEMANMAWAVERRVEDAWGDRVDRHEEQQRSRGATDQQRLTGDIGDAELAYRLMTPVPEHWIPLVPVAEATSANGLPILRLERRAIIRSGAAAPSAPKGRVLVPERPLQIEEEEVPRSGVVTQRAFQFSRWTDGRALLWMGRRKKSGQGEGASGLLFDSVERPR
jgi:hypothetical protein